jgi:hypothetical protein
MLSGLLRYYQNIVERSSNYAVLHLHGLCFRTNQVVLQIDTNGFSQADLVRQSVHVRNTCIPSPVAKLEVAT